MEIINSTLGVVARDANDIINNCPRYYREFIMYNILYGPEKKKKTIITKLNSYYTCGVRLSLVLQFRRCKLFSKKKYCPEKQIKNPLSLYSGLRRRFLGYL